MLTGHSGALAGSIAVVTDAGSGRGLAVARRLQQAGSLVYAVGDFAPATVPTGVQWRVVRLCDEAAMAAVRAEIALAHHRVDLLVTDRPATAITTRVVDGPLCRNVALAVFAPLLASGLSLMLPARIEPDSIGLDEWLSACTSLLASAGLATAGRERARGGLSPWQIRRIAEHVRAHLQREISLAELAAVAGLSPFHFCRAFKSTTRLTPTQWITERRIERAQALMRDSPWPLLQIAQEVGYGSQSAFTTAFRRVTGVTPQFWRRTQADRTHPHGRHAGRRLRVDADLAG